MSYFLHVLIMIALYFILSVSLNLVVGYAGMLSLCHAAFFGLGAYASALLTLKLGWSFVPSMLAATAIAALLGYLVAAAAVRFHGDFFVLATMGFQAIAFTVLYNWTKVTNGPVGVSGIPRPSFFGQYVSTLPAFLLLASAAAALVWFIASRITSAAYGRSLQAIRDDEIAAASLGKDVRAYKRSAFCVAAAAAAFAGSLFGSYVSYIDPSTFTIEESVFMLCAVVIGGAGSVLGSAAGAALVIALPEALRFIAIPDAVAANSRQIVWGLLLILMMRLRPQGLAGRYGFSK